MTAPPQASIDLREDADVLRRHQHPGHDPIPDRVGE
jgi:hypothetical protein